jgi:hypothetical protein
MHSPFAGKLPESRLYGQVDKFRVADHPGVSPQVGLIVLLAEATDGSAPRPEVAGLQTDGGIRG